MRQDAARQLEAGHRRQIDVDHADVRALGQENALGAFGIGRLQHDDLRLVGEHGAAAGRHDRMIINDQNAHDFRPEPSSRCCAALRTDAQAVNPPCNLGDIAVRFN